MFQKLSFFITLFLVSQISVASHIIGGEITWDNTSNGQYIFKLVLYRDCSGLPLPTGNNFITGPSGNISLSYNAAQSGTIVANPNGNGCLIERGIYLSAPVSLNGTPPATGWEFVYSTCCRNTSENLNGSPGLYLRSTMYPYVPPGANNALNTSQAYDRSPQFLTGPVRVATDGPHQINYQGVDPDHDSVAYSFAAPFESAGTGVAFSAGYTLNSPFPDSSENPLNGPNTIDPYSGIIDVETYNANSGFYASALKVSTYRNGQLIAEVIRDMPVYFGGPTAPGSSANNAPSIFIDTAQYAGLSRSGSTYRITAMDNDSLSFQIQTFDGDLSPSGLSQTVCLGANALKLNSLNLSADTNCVGGAPCATITPTGNSAYCAVLTNTYQFDWVAQCQLLSAGLRGRTSYVFHIYASDNASFPKTSFITLIVDLFPSQNNAPNLAIAGGNTAGSVDLTWPANTAQAASPFSKYMIYANNGPGTSFSLLDSITDRQQTSLSLTGLNYPTQFYMNQVTGSCRAVSQNSDTISSIVLSNDGFATAGIALYPNPAADFIWLEQLSFQHQIKRIGLYSLDGILLEQLKISEQNQRQKLPLSQADGLYLLRLETDQTVLTKRILIKTN
jgi:hypothetical protein